MSIEQAQLLAVMYGIERIVNIQCCATNWMRTDVVLADGSFVTASEKENPDLFWALRGGAAISAS